jgi:hypothetical protein
MASQSRTMKFSLMCQRVLIREDDPSGGRSLLLLLPAEGEYLPDCFGGTSVRRKAFIGLLLMFRPTYVFGIYILWRPYHC